MKKLSVSVKVITSLLIITVLISWTSSSLSAMNLSGQVIVRKEYNPKLESVLGELVENHLQSRILAQDFACQKGITLRNDRVTVILVPSIGEDASVIDQAKLLSYGAIIEASSQHLIRAKIPISALEKVADNVSGISYIRLPHKPFLPALLEGSNFETASVSEGVSLTNATVYHNAGYEGQNTKIAIIDALGFVGWEDARDSGELPSDVITKDFTGTGLSTGKPHGTDVAKLAHDMAPKAKLYLIKIGDEVDLENAKDYCIAEDIDIINHSWVWHNTNFTDGTGIICDIANDARTKGIFWVNAAGNSAKSHYQAFFSDPDGNGWHEYIPGDATNWLEKSTLHPHDIFLTWDCWPVTDQDYDLYLFDSAGDIVARSENIQNGTQPPMEHIHIENPSDTYRVAVKKVNATQINELKIFTIYSLQYRTAAHSILSPADATQVMAVGAIKWQNWETGPQKDYSSQGSTNDGRIKPDICGPNEVTSGPCGTSGATPHVAGAAALILSKYPDCTASQLQATLEDWAIDMGVSGKDNIYGSGRLRLLLEPLVNPNLQALKVYPNPFKPSTGHTQIIFDGLTSDVRIRIFTLSGELIADSNELKLEKIWIWDVTNKKGKSIVRGIYIYLVTNSAGEKKTGKIAIIK